MNQTDYKQTSVRAFDVVIIGAGMAGASLAWRLASERKVLLIERETQPGYHATGRSAAMFMETYGPPGVRALTRASRSFYEHPPAGFGLTPLISERGVLYVARSGQENLMNELHQNLVRSGAQLEWLNTEATLRLVPVLRPEQVFAAWYDRASQDLDVHRLHQGFLAGFRSKGGSLQTGAGLRRAQRLSQTWQLELSDGALVEAGLVVNAAGAWADEVASLLGAPRIGLEPRRRSAFTFKPPEGIAIAHWPAVISIDERYYFKPDAGQLLGSPANADPTTPHDVRPEELDIALGIHLIEEATTLTIRRPTSTWAGLRSFVADGELVIGHDEDCPGLFWLAGQGGYGIQSAAGASELACALICGQAPSEHLRLHGVDPLRFAPSRLRGPSRL